MRFLLDRLPEQDVEGHLLGDEGEHVVDLVRKHGVVYVLPGAEAIAAVGIGVFSVFTSVQVAWFFMLLSAGVGLHALYLIAAEHRDVFVITNMRVFRASGVFSVRIATMPITRILDITVEKPLVGRLLGYGHFVFESAAQAQGLRDIKFIGDPDARDLTIQRVVQRSGIRARFDPRTMEGR